MTEHFRESFNRNRGISIHPAIARAKSAMRSSDEMFRAIELRHQAVQRQLVFDYGGLGHNNQELRPSSLCTSSRISKIEIIGRIRMNKNSNATKSPRVPASTP